MPNLPDNANADVFDFKDPGKPSCSWGELTKGAAMDDGMAHGMHAADPSDDGLGPEERVGLANVVNQGDLDALCEFIAGVEEFDILV